jgi:large subunit ribosomal protein L21
MTYAIIQLAGKQYKVAEGDNIIVDRLESEVGQEFTIADVLMIDDGKKPIIGTPLIAKAAVTLKVVSNQKGEKLRVAKYKAKSRYRKTRGHRSSESTVEVLRITQ